MLKITRLGEFALDHAFKLVDADLIFLVVRQLLHPGQPGTYPGVSVGGHWNNRRITAGYGGDQAKVGYCDFVASDKVFALQ